MGFIERGRTESLAEHLLRNAEGLGADASQIERLRYAFRLTRGTRAQQVEAGQIAFDVRAELQAGVAQVAAQAEARGEKVARFNDAGARRIRTRDGLVTLVENKGLTSVHGKAGLAYRTDYEAIGGSLGSILGHAGEGRSVPRWGELPVYVNDDGELAIMVGAISSTVAAHLVRLNRVERAVAHAAEDGRELPALRLIAGEGRSVLDAAGSSGHARAAYKAALARALTVAAGVLRITGN